MRSRVASTNTKKRLVIDLSTSDEDDGGGRSHSENPTPAKRPRTSACFSCPRSAPCPGLGVRLSVKLSAHPVWTGGVLVQGRGRSFSLGTSARGFVIDESFAELKNILVECWTTGEHSIEYFLNRAAHGPISCVMPRRGHKGKLGELVAFALKAQADPATVRTP